MTVLVRPRAEQDLASAFRFYEKQRKGLGLYFLRCLRADLDMLEYHAGVHPKVHGHFRSVSRRFPYAIYYDVSGGDVWVIAVLDCRSSPRIAERRLG